MDRSTCEPHASFMPRSDQFRSRLGSNFGSKRLLQTVHTQLSSRSRPKAADLADMDGLPMGGKPSRICGNGISFSEYSVRIAEPASHFPKRGPGSQEERAYGLAGSWVSEGDLANLNEPVRPGIRVPWCPAQVDLHDQEISDHRMLTVRGTQRRYRENGGRGYRTIQFFCWQCQLSPS